MDVSFDSLISVATALCFAILAAAAAFAVGLLPSQSSFEVISALVVVFLLISLAAALVTPAGGPVAGPASAAAPLPVPARPPYAPWRPPPTPPPLLLPLPRSTAFLDTSLVNSRAKLPPHPVDSPPATRARASPFLAPPVRIGSSGVRSAAPASRAAISAALLRGNRDTSDARVVDVEDAVGIDGGAEPLRMEEVSSLDDEIMQSSQRLVADDARRGEAEKLLGRALQQRFDNILHLQHLQQQQLRQQQQQEQQQQQLQLQLQAQQGLPPPEELQLLQQQRISPSELSGPLVLEDFDPANAAAAFFTLRPEITYRTDWLGFVISDDIENAPDTMKSCILKYKPPQIATPSAGHHSSVWDLLGFLRNKFGYVKLGRTTSEANKNGFVSSLVHFLIYLDGEDKSSNSTGKLLAAAMDAIIVFMIETDTKERAYNYRDYCDVGSDQIKKRRAELRKKSLESFSLAFDLASGPDSKRQLTSVNTTVGVFFRMRLRGRVFAQLPFLQKSAASSEYADKVNNFFRGKNIRDYPDNFTFKKPSGDPMDVSQFIVESTALLSLWAHVSASDKMTIGEVWSALSRVANAKHTGFVAELAVVSFFELAFTAGSRLRLAYDDPPTGSETTPVAKLMAFMERRLAPAPQASYSLYAQATEGLGKGKNTILRSLLSSEAALKKSDFETLVGKKENMPTKLGFL